MIPIIEQPTNVTQFRPIAYCNVLYKIISKMLCEKLKQVLGQLVDPVQSAFVEDRNIMHNILICQDMLKMYKRKELPARCIIKVDLRNAYDSLSWSFIEELLCGLKFPKKFVDWIMQCITTPSYSLSINRSVSGFFSGNRGIRQGDPISPFIFVLAMEYIITRLMKKMCKRAEFKYHYRCDNLKLNHTILIC